MGDWVDYSGGPQIPDSQFPINYPITRLPSYQIHLGAY
jgi:hypothetical protein